MYNFQVLTDQDRKEAAAIEKRRRDEEARKKRFFDAKVRTIGIDYSGIRNQIIEKNQQKIQEMKLEEAYVRQQQRTIQLTTEIEAQAQNERRRIQSEIDQFRKNYQKVEDRREFDLYDPDAQKKSLPMRVGDDDPRLGISSAQKFQGEDLRYEVRNKIQRGQLQAWYGQQLIERETAEMQRKMAEDAYQAALIARDLRAVELDKLEKECQRKLDEATFKFNNALAEEVEARRLMKAKQEEDDNLAEIYNHITSPLLCEDPKQAISSMGQHRKLVDHYKGMSAEELQRIIDDQKRQMLENKLKRDAEAKMESDWWSFSSRVNRSAELKQRQLEREKKEEERKILEKNLSLSKEQKVNKDFIDKVLYTNAPTADYFGQFNTTSR